jgi:hypothetical protein
MSEKHTNRRKRKIISPSPSEVQEQSCIDAGEDVHTPIRKRRRGRPSKENHVHTSARCASAAATSSPSSPIGMFVAINDSKPDATAAAVAAAAGKSAPQATAATRTSASIETANLQVEQTSGDLTCTVCRELPQRQILQCTNGHILCESDYGKILLSGKSICPICRIKLDRNSPSRNIFAEQILAALVVACTNSGCDTKVQFSKLNAHMKQECHHRQVVCKYNALGCTWSGVASDHNRHETEDCDIVTKSIDSILNTVTVRNEAAAAERKLLEIKCKNDAILSALLSKRCVDFTLHNLVFPSSGKSGKFSPVGLEMVAVMDKDRAPDSIEFVLKSVKPIKHRTIVEVFILLSDDMPFQMPLFTGRLTFSATHTCSERIVLNLTPKQADELTGLPNIVLRIGSLDCTPGDMVAAFNSSHEENDPSLGGFIADEDDVEEPSGSDNDDDYEEENMFIDNTADVTEKDDDDNDDGRQEEEDEEEEEEGKEEEEYTSSHRQGRRRRPPAFATSAKSPRLSRRKFSQRKANEDENDNEAVDRRPASAIDASMASAALPRRRGRYGRG